MTARRATRVHIDAADHTQVFDCTVLVPENLWNGFEMPTFDRATAERVIATFEDDETTAFLWTTDREGRDCLLYGSHVDEPGYAWWEFVGDEETGYGIGSGSWVWEEINPEAPTDPVALDAWLAAQRGAY